MIITIHQLLDILERARDSGCAFPQQAKLEPMVKTYHRLLAEDYATAEEVAAGLDRHLRSPYASRWPTIHDLAPARPDPVPLVWSCIVESVASVGSHAEPVRLLAEVRRRCDLRRIPVDIDAVSSALTQACGSWARIGMLDSDEARGYAGKTWMTAYRAIQRAPRCLPVLREVAR